MGMSHLQLLRKYELEAVLELLPTHSRILEIGAGDGWQAGILQAKGFAVEAIDVSVSNCNFAPVVSYDGKHIPFADNSFDVVFSSNTMEHIPDVALFQKEILRVLVPDGLAIHILPTTTWRFWTILTHYVFVLKGLYHSLRKVENGSGITYTSARKKNSFIRLVLKAIFPPRHGERGNSLSEMWYFSSFWWKNLFYNCGWEVSSCKPIHLFYTGSILLGEKLSVRSRCKLSRIFGSSTFVYVLTPCSKNWIG